MMDENKPVTFDRAAKQFSGTNDVILADKFLQTGGADSSCQWGFELHTFIHGVVK